jgi:heme exporter protein C
MNWVPWTQKICWVLFAVLFALGSYWGLFITPPERMMGDVYRIYYVHVPCAWAALMAYTCALVCSLLYLWKNNTVYDALAAASAETGVVFNALLLVTGSIWGKPTWGVWWTWDPRLTSAAVMFMAFSGYLLLRTFVDNPSKRAAWAAVTAIVIYADIPIVWFSVKWWNSLHQLQSNPSTVDKAMHAPLQINAFAMLFCAIGCTLAKYRVLLLRHHNTTLPPLEETP